MLTDFLFTVSGLVLLLLAGEATVRGAVGLARILGVSPAMIGLTVVAFGTSAPELVVSLQASLEGAPDIAVGNVVGSNIANILLILGAGALIAPLICDPGMVRRDGAAMIFALILLCVLGLTGTIFAWQGALMVLVLVGYVAGSYFIDRRNGTAVAELHAREAEETAGVPQAAILVTLYLVVGLFGLVLGAHLLVDGAVGVARAAGVSESVIGLSLVAVGTSLPELAATVVAAWRRHTDVAIANVLGSNLFNVLLILGAASLVAPLPVAPDIVRVDLWVMLGSGIVLIPIMITGWHVSRREGIFLLLLYAAYIASMAMGYGRPVAAA
ncbi:MAG: calcium/sodium antiporter [Alphaproteobacteria bacterium]|nr:calcium/sodium antiporter [Alphaproteobacteria bacterium]